MADMITPAEFARQIGVTKQAVGKAIKVGRVPVYDVSGASVPADFAGRKFVKPIEAAAKFNLNRARIDDDFAAAARAEIDRVLDIEAPPPSSSEPDSSSTLVAAKTDRETLQADLLRMRLARERGDLVSLSAQLEAFETAGRSVARSWQALPTWAEEIYASAQSGLPALTAWLRVRANEQCGQIADMMATPADDDADNSADDAS